MNSWLSEYILPIILLEIPLFLPLHPTHTVSMVSFKFAAFAVAALSAVNVIAAEDTETVKVCTILYQL